MMFKKYPESRVCGPLRSGLLAVILCGVAVVAPAQAQEGNDRQLPADFADQQVPPSFPDVNDSGEAAAEDANAGSSKVATEDVTVDESAVPPAPAQKQLVPSKAMGVGARTEQDGEAITEPAAAEAPPALPDILEKYAAEAKEKDAPENFDGDALPDAEPPVPPMGAIGGDFAASSGGEDSEMSIQKKEALKEEIRAEAFDAAMTGIFPLTTEQIEQLLKRYDVTQKAVKKPTYDLPKPEISVQNISLDPGVVPPTIKTAIGNVTTLNILDATGSPWPVQDVTWAGDYEIVEPEVGGHVIRITPMSHFARGNIVIRLLTLKVPLTITLETGRDVVQYRVDIRVPEYGPFAAAPLMQGGKSMVAGSSDLTAVLDGAMPAGMVKLDVVGVDGRTTAYALNGTTYVRTPLTLLSPAWQSSVSSADGMNVYALSNAPVLLLSDGGSFTRATLKEKEDLLDE